MFISWIIEKKKKRKTDFKNSSKLILPYISAMSCDNKNNNTQGTIVVKKDNLMALISKPLFWVGESKVPVKAMNAEGIPSEKHITNNWLIVSERENNPYEEPPKIFVIIRVTIKFKNIPKNLNKKTLPPGLNICFLISNHKFSINRIHYNL